MTFGAKKSQQREVVEWVNLYSTELYNYCVVRLHNRQDAEDLVQVTFLKAYKSVETLKPGSNIKAWLFTILLNNIRDHLRKLGRQPETTELASEQELENTLVDLSNNPEEALIKKDTMTRLASGIAALPDHFASPLILREVREMSYQEIASMLSIPVGTVMSRLSRARKMLVNYMNQDAALEKSSVQGE